MTDARTDRFRKLADTFCEMIENGLSGSVPDRAVELAGMLERLYAEASALVVPDDLPEAEEPIKIPSEEYERIFGGMSDLLGEHDHYWTVDPLGIETYDEPEVTAGQLHDDLADIWCDLKVGLRTWQRNGNSNRVLAVWHWQFSFRAHWGAHTVDALKLLHRIAGQKG